MAKEKPTVGAVGRCALEGSDSGSAHRMHTTGPRQMQRAVRTTEARLAAQHSCAGSSGQPAGESARTVRP